MTRRARMSLVSVLALATTAAAARGQGQAVSANTRVAVLRNVNSALAIARAGRFSDARGALEHQLSRCTAGALGRECRILSASGLGALLQQQGLVDVAHHDSLYTASIALYNQVLREAPRDADAIYGMALAYRGLEPHEWMESFFRQAPSLDPSRAALYYTFQGDYLAARKRFTEAATAYRDAIQAGAATDGARGGLVDALSGMGASSSAALVQLGSAWEAQFPESALNAYRAVLVNSFAPGNSRDAFADSAMIGLVRVQARNRLAIGAVPMGVSDAWTPVREIRSFMDSADVTAAPWWRLGREREAVLAQAALAGGRAAAASGASGLAERLFTAGVRVARRSSALSLDLQRELALLYFRRPELDRDGRKFNALEHDIFDGKMGALASGDLEAAQRYHTTLGLIYAGRGTWTSASLPRNAVQQLTWALDKADERSRRQRFYQPLPELRRLLAHGLDSLGHASQAARAYADAARALLDVDDIPGAGSAARNAVRLGGEARIANAAPVLSLRSGLLRGGDAARAACAPERIAALGRAGDSEFLARQRFKILADCAALDPAAAARGRAIAAFALVDGAHLTLVGSNDVARFERSMRVMLQPFGVTPRTAQLDRVAPAAGPSILVWLAGETAPYRYPASLDDVIAARAVSVLGARARPFHLGVADGVVTIPREAAISPAMVSRLKAVSGVRSVVIGPSRS